MRHKILLVDDEQKVLAGLKRLLRREPYDVYTANSAEEGLDILERENIGAVISDQQMPGMSGTEFLAHVNKRYPDTVRIMITGNASLDMAIQNVNEGNIYGFFIKPFNDVELIISLRHGLQQRELIVESRKLLGAVRHQSNILEELESHHPGLTKINKDASGAIVLDNDETDIETLIQQIGNEWQRSKDILDQDDSKAA
ncbi:MAG: response regulator [Candidatus Eisenbacteria bacterium]|uniref:Response regulator n=1 Tax=Eiseniibacteriota bacterium TaxID=2212470 RepID=A0A948S2V7_UNCEI|nr:response regulator [Candidatus Eisenbacteria bacterium]MBU1948863.1 response regulator [Candidatus Eisenbacteria bacterium]MBU2692809.1 response regulator [Candidatus Eisenbacteria bacterium]